MIFKGLRLFSLFIYLVFSNFVFSQNYTSYFTGNSMDTITNPHGGVCMMGGASEHDNAMKWFLGRANGGDVVVLRTSGSNGYNNYFYSQLGISVNSVETIVCLNQNSGEDNYIIDKINKAEAIWFAGGDQWDYISFWRNTSVNIALNNAINRDCVIGGTSAGMAILGGHYFTAENGTITSNSALFNPYNTLATVSNDSFLQLPFLTNVITDTHYDNPDRRGRHTVFIAKQTKATNTAIYGIACEEYVAVCIDTNGIARVFGEYPSYDEQAYFISPNCEIPNNSPELCESNQPLTWNFGGEALKVFKANGTWEGTTEFDLNNWSGGTNGIWQNWFVQDGIFISNDDIAPDCTSSTQNIEIQNSSPTNPAHLSSWNDWTESESILSIHDVFGKQIYFEIEKDKFFINTEIPGLYFIRTSKSKTIKVYLIE
jgi:cyanophycinase-like exopeptidase